MILNQIVAVSKNLVIGKNNALLWHYPEDLKFFKKTTQDKIIIMGRKTFDSILKPKGKPLPHRLHIVISRQEPSVSYPSVVFVKDIKEAYAMAHGLITAGKYPEEVFIIGGAEIYQQTLQDCTKLYITRIDKIYDGDVFYSPAYQIHFTLTSSQPSLEHPEIHYEVWKKS